MHKLRSDGMRYMAIAAWLESRKILAPLGRAKWYALTVVAIFKSALYIP